MRRRAVLPLLLAAACAPRVVPDRPPFESDVQECLLRTRDLGAVGVLGRLRLHLLVRRTGWVYAAYVHNEGGVVLRPLQGCLAMATTGWVLAPADAPYERALEISFVGGPGSDTRYAVFFSADLASSVPPLPIEELAARETLTIADFATDAERGVALVAARRPAEALPLLRAAVESDPSDPEALLGLVRALTAGPAREPAEARGVAERLLALAEGSVLGEEAMLRACLASRDDRCALERWARALKTPDVAARSRILQELEAPVREAAMRLRVEAGGAKPPADAPAPQPVLR